jgi:hypothetical protein
MDKKEESHAKREEKRRQDKNATCASLFDLTKRATELEE